MSRRAADRRGVPTIGSGPVMTGPFLAVAGALPLAFDQIPNPTPQQVRDNCGENATALCQHALKKWGEGAAQFVNIIDQPLQIIFIVVVAWVVNRLARTIIKRTLNRTMSDRSQRVGRALRKATPNVLLR